MKKIIELLKDFFNEDEEKIKKIQEIEKDWEVNVDDIKTKSSQNNSNTDQITELKQIILKYTDENKKLLDQITMLEQREKQRAEQIQQQIQKEKQEKIKKTIETAIKQGKIPPKNEEIINLYKDMLEKDYDKTSKIIEQLPEAIKPNENKQQGTPEKNNIPVDRFHLIENAKKTFKINDN